MMTVKDYPEILKTPFKSKGLVAAFNLDDGLYDEYYKKEYFFKLCAIFDYYNIDVTSKNAFILLTKYLLRDHVKGFSIKNTKRKGSPSLWSGIMGVDFYYRVMFKVEKEGVSKLKAIEIVSKEIGLKNDPLSLNTRFNEIKKAKDFKVIDEWNTRQIEKRKLNISNAEFYILGCDAKMNKILENLYLKVKAK